MPLTQGSGSGQSVNTWTCCVSAECLACAAAWDLDAVLCQLRSQCCHVPKLAPRAVQWWCGRPPVQGTPFHRSNAQLASVLDSRRITSRASIVWPSGLLCQPGCRRCLVTGWTCSTSKPSQRGTLGQCATIYRRSSPPPPVVLCWLPRKPTAGVPCMSPADICDACSTLRLLHLAATSRRLKCAVHSIASAVRAQVT